MRLARSWWAIWWTLIGGALVCACAPQTEPPVDVMALVRTAGSSGGPGGTYQPTRVQLRTLSDVVAMKGSVATLVGGARIDVDPNDPMLGLVQTDEDLADVFIKSGGRDVRASYVEKDGVLWPSDFHTWNLVSTYFNLEQAFEYFQALGASGATLADVRVFYFPEFVLRELGPDPIVDNALYFAPVKSFMVLPFEELQDAPLALNSGVMAHEYAHLVFTRAVYGGAAMPTALFRWSSTLGTRTPQVNVLKSLDEGLADYHAFVASCRTAFGCDSRYLATSFPQATTDARDLALPDKCLTSTMQTALGTMGTDFSKFGYHYQVGTVIASSLYHAGASPNDWTVIARTALAAYSDPADPGIAELVNNNLETPESFTLEAVLDSFLRHTQSDALRTKLCGQFMGRLKVSRDNLPSCPAQAVPTPECEGK